MQPLLHHAAGHDPPQPGADDLLGPAGGRSPAAQRVDVGSVEEVDPTRRRCIHDGVTSPLVALEPERHGSQTKPRDAQTGAAELRIFDSLWSRSECADYDNQPQYTIRYSAITVGLERSRATRRNCEADHPPGDSTRYCAIRAAIRCKPASPIWRSPRWSTVLSK